MELTYPWVLYIGIPILIITIIWRRKKKNNYTDGKKVANTKYIKDIPYYKSVIIKYKMYTFLMKCICVLCIILSLVLIARPVSIDTIEPELYSRDIFLCMDVSGSVLEVNVGILESMKDIVKELKGERVGVVIFNASAVVLIPLTDDYEYIIETLDKLKKSFDSAGNMGDLYDYWYSTAGTIEGYKENGSSLIGDGLASCVYNFSNLEEQRSRAIIFSTDNDLYGTPVFTLREAAELAKSKNITVYGIAATPTEDEEEFRKSMELTGGSLYSAESTTTVPEMVKKINEKEKSKIKGKKITLKTDIPQKFFIALVISVSVLFVLNKRVNL